MSNSQYSDPYLIEALRIFHGLSLRQLAQKAGLDPSGLSYWLRGKESRVSLERLKPAMALLGIGDTGLVPGVHKWSLPTPSRENTSRAEKTVQTLLPGGGTIFQIRLSGILNPISTNHLITTLAFLSWVLVPDHFPDVRLIFRIGYHSRTKQLLTTPPFPFGSPFLVPANLGTGWRWNTDDPPDTDTPKKWNVLERNKYKKLMEDDFTVDALDNFLGLSNEDDWTWDRLVSALKAQGKFPEEVASELGLVERETK